MAVDPNELLIFKKHGIVIGKAEAQQTPKDEKLPTPVSKTNTELARLQDTEMPQIKKQEEEKIPISNINILKEYYAEKARTDISSKEEKIQVMVANEEAQAEKKLTESKRIIYPKIEEEEISTKRAENQTCAYHPWRPAYANCEICKRPFCYPDLIISNHKPYCITDVDKTKASTSEKVSTAVLTYVTALLFIISAVVFIYYMYPQAVFLIDYSLKIGIANFFLRLNTTYDITALNLLLAVFGLLSAWFVLTETESGFILAGLVISTTPLILGYEYINSNVQYLLILSVLYFVDLGFLMLSRFSYIGKRYYTKVAEPEAPVRWPVSETF